MHALLDQERVVDHRDADRSKPPEKDCNPFLQSRSQPAPRCENDQPPAERKGATGTARPAVLLSITKLKTSSRRRRSALSNSMTEFTMADPAASAEQDKTLDRLERQSEAHRAEFARTLDRLRNSVSPPAIQADLKRRASHAGRGMLADIERRVLDNPLQTVAVGAGLAYPVWQILRNLPAPILLLGAGVALTRRGSGEDTIYDASYSGGTGTSTSTAQSLSEPKSDTSAKAGSTASSPAHGATERARAMMDEALDAVQRTVSSASDQAAELARHGSGSASRTASAASQRAATAGQVSREAVSETVERYPLVVGGVGLVLGAALAACLPSSRTENRLFGETSENLKDQARDTVAHAYSEAKASGERIVENTMDEARQQDLTPHDAGKGIQEAGKKVRAVADRAATATANEKQASSGEAATGQDTGSDDNS